MSQKKPKLEELDEHGESLAPMVEATKKVNLPDEIEEEGIEKPKGLSIEKVSVIGKKDPMKMEEDMESKAMEDKEIADGTEAQEMTDDELKELLAKYLKG
jgi:hypothetical protein